MKKPDYKKPDYYAKLAKQQGFPARSVFKLEELDERRHFLRKGAKVLDLGASPGSWMQYASQAVGGAGLVVGVDLKPLNRAIAANEVFIERDINALEPAELKEKFGAFDIVLSDLAPATTGQKDVDHLRSISLSERAFFLAEELLKPGGVFAAKVFQGGSFDGYVKMLKGRFAQVGVTKPKSSRPNSREMYVFAKGLKPRG